MSRDRTNWPRCLLWHGWLPGCLLVLLAPLGLLHQVTLPVLRMLWVYLLSVSSVGQDDVQDMVDDVPVAPNIWTAGGGEPIPHLDVEIAGVGAFVHSEVVIFDINQLGLCSRS